MVILSLAPWALIFHACGHNVAAKPSPKPPVWKPLPGGLSILAYNDLKNEPAPGSGAILIDNPTDYTAATKACGQLSESLWAHHGNNFDSGLHSSLAYQVHLGNHDSDAKFWIAKKDGSCRCQALGVDGSVQETRCSERLPVLCTQSAPVSSELVNDTSVPYQVTQKVGDAYFTGYRDFFAWKFRGIRYAPTPQRYEYSTPLRGASGHFSALDAGADCLQRGMPLSSDDCLFINLWTPYLPQTGAKASPKVALKPVLVYLYGGAFQFGSGKDPNFDLTNMASRGDVVTVTINYRLGNAGMLVFKDGIHRGNLPISDQISGLTWVAENIASFGGDPDKVTILGESAGAMSVRYLMASPEAKGLFRGAMMQSDGNEGIAAAAGRFWSIEQSYEYFTKNVLELVGCADAADDLACLRDVPGVILSGLPENRSVANVAVIDGKYLTTPFLPVDGSGFAQNIAVLSGVVRDEIAIFDILQNQIYWPPVTFEIWVGVLCLYQDFLRVNPAAILGSLPIWGITPESNYTQLFNATTKILTDNVYTCTEQARSYSGVKNGAFKKVYAFNAYRTYSPPTITASYCNAPVTAEHPFGDPSLEYYRCHASTQVTMFGNYARMGMPERDEFDVPYSQLMLDYWASFVRTGDPNPDHAWLTARDYKSTLAEVQRVGEWSQVDADSPEWMILEWGGHMAPFGKEAGCNALGQPLTYWEDPAPGPNPPSEVCSFLGS